MATLARTVWVEQDGVPTGFKAGSTPPAWAAKLITNPAAWAETAETGVPVEAVKEEPESTASGAGEADTVAIPPKAGKGSSASAWAAYAKANGFSVEDDAKASEIREALEEAGVPVE